MFNVCVYCLLTTTLLIALNIHDNINYHRIEYN